MGPVVPGDVGLGRSSQPPVFDPERLVPSPAHARRWPAAIRLLSHDTPMLIPQMDEATAWRLTRKFSHPKMKRVWQRHRPANDKEAAFLELLAGSWVGKWWKRPESFRSPRVFRGWHGLERELGAPHLGPFEIAMLRLTDDIAMDADVLAIAAYSQGLEKFWAARFPTWADWNRHLNEGLMKIHRSPWVAFALASHLMPATGVFFPNVSFFDSSLRMEYLLKNPFMATDGELPHILRSDAFRTAYRESARLRSRGGYSLPAGPWYACGMTFPLGDHFRRSYRAAKQGD
jgi:hypothetical protein